MGLAHPSLNTFSKKKTKTKYKSAEHAKQAREAEALQIAMYKKWSITNDNKSKKSKSEFVPNYSHRSTDTKVSSVSFSGGVCSRKTDRVYTGDLIKGIVVQHKSCLQPIIDKEDAIASARMRR